MSDIKLYLDYKDLSWVITIVGYCYDGFDEIYPESGYVELDGEITDIVDITEDDKAILRQMENDNESLFEEICELHDEKVRDAIIKKEQYCRNEYNY